MGRRAPAASGGRLPIVLAASLTVLVAAAAVAATTIELQITLPVRARLDLTGRDSIALAPCIMVDREEEGRGPGRDGSKEFGRYLRKLLRRETELKMVDPGPLDYPTADLTQLAADLDFWRALGERTRADLLLACSLDFDVRETSGYRTEKYASPYDGRITQRQVLVEESGIEYDIVLQVYDGRTGEQLIADNFKDFQEQPAESEDPLAGMFENLYTVEDRIAGIFTQGKIEASRTLFLEESAAE